MDLRIKKTRAALKEAFLTLRAKKPLEKITIKELTEMANINKATYYLHYRDIYDLSETLERELMQRCLSNVEHQEYIITDVEKFIEGLKESVLVNEKEIKILFEGSRSTSFTKLFEEEINNIIVKNFPGYEPTLESRMKLTFLIHGAYYTYFKYSEYGMDKVINLIARLSDGSIVIHKGSNKS